MTTVRRRDDDDTNRNDDRRGLKRLREDRDGDDDGNGSESSRSDDAPAASEEEESTPPLGSEEAPPRPSIEVDGSPSAMAPHNRRSNLLLPDGRRITKLRLEAIFHPKFDNENRTDASSIRSAMLRKVANGMGCLEVTLKHSGSLLLWSGGDDVGRYYSKNSTDNVFTAVGECLLRQHFARAWSRRTVEDDGDDGDRGKRAADVDEAAYRRCGRYVSSSRLTLAFEVVTSRILGDHGERPKKDYLVLTAIADRKTRKFLSTSEIASLANRFRLPINDSWIFRTKDGTERLFELYDAKRETGTAEDVVEALDEAAEGRTEGMYPHSMFQGNVLEGIVIRYVPNDRDRDIGPLEKKAESRRILDLVPPETPPSFELLSEETAAPPVLTTDLRRLYERSREPSQKDFESMLRDVLDRSDASRRRVQNPRAEAAETTAREKRTPVLDVPAMADELLERRGEDGCLDEETIRIARLIQRLRDLNQPCDFKVLREQRTTSSSSRGRSKEKKGYEETTRWLCIIHVFNDFTFQKYYKSMEPGDMTLYRGFCFELGFGDDETGEDVGDRDGYGKDASAMPDSSARADSAAASDDDDDNDDEKLMLKMKFLPYMVRTFGCRNGLKTLDKNGPDAFDRYALSLLTKWGVSRAAVARWQPFFQAWGRYAHGVLRRRGGREAPDDDGGGDKDEDDLPPLSGRDYLDHLERFSELYYGNKLRVDDDRNDDERPSATAPTFRGIVVVVSLDETLSSDAANRVARSLGARRTIVGTKNLGEEEASRSLLPDGGGGLVCAATVGEGVSKIRRLFKKFGDSISVALVGCADEDVVASSGVPEGKERSATMGRAKSFRNSRCACVVDVAASDVVVAATAEDGRGNDAFEAVLDRLREVSDALPKPDSRPGLLLFFPGLPGSGKSTLCGPSTKKALEARVAEMSQSSSDAPERRRNVVVRVGDDVNEKYWPLVRRENMEDPSSIYVADKNAPPPSWRTVGDVCSASRGSAVAVLPDAEALSTTTVSGVKEGAPDDREHRYPFSLRYLAVCVQRVLDRPRNSHGGKLDASTKHACMIVVKFFCLYRGLTAEGFEARLRKTIDEAGASRATSFVRVPFFATTSLEDLLPRELDATLRDAIRLQFALDNQAGSGARKEENAELMNAMEQRIRASITANRELLRASVVDEETSRESLVSQLAGHISTLDASFGDGGPSAAPTPAPKFIKIASIDVDVEAVHSLLTASAKGNPSIAAFLDRIGGLADVAPRKANAEGAADASETKKAARCILETHVTMAHHLRQSQVEMETAFGELRGRRVDVDVTGFLFGDDVAALSVDVAATTSGEPKLDVPAPRNEFPHVTVWCGDGIPACRSNDLPAMVTKGDAERVEFDEVSTLEGTFKFWTGEDRHI